MTKLLDGRNEGAIADRRRILAVTWALLAACGGAASGVGTGSGQSNGTTTAGTGTEATRPGTTSPSTTTASASGGGGGLDIGTQAAPDGALFFHDAPLRGEASVTGLVTIVPGGAQGGAPPADTLVTLNGVQLVHAVLGGAVSPMHFTVDPAGAQPTIGPDGFLHISATSASAGASRVLNLACPFSIPVTSTPAAGSSLSGVPQVELSWAAGELPVQSRDYTAFGLTPPSVRLLGFDAQANVASQLGSLPQPLAPAAASATLAVPSTTASGYLVELRYPGVYFIDGQTGGACGRTRRFAFAK